MARFEPIFSLDERKSEEFQLPGGVISALSQQGVQG